MAVNDIRSNVETQLAQLDIITTNTTTDGASIDTSDFDGGLMFEIMSPLYTDGTYTLLLEESTTGDFSGEETAIADANLIGTEAGAALSAVTAEGGVLNSIGVFGNEKFVRSTIVSAGTSSGATLVVLVTQVPEIKPSANLSA